MAKLLCENKCSEVIHEIIVKSQFTVAYGHSKTWPLPSYQLEMHFFALPLPVFPDLPSVPLPCYREASAVPRLPLESREHGGEMLILGLQVFSVQ